MAVGQTTQTTQVYSASIVTSDPVSGTVEAVLPGSLRQVTIQGTPVAFRWPVAGEVWRIININGSFYLDSPLPIQENSSTAAMSADNDEMTTINSIAPGDAVINSPTGKVWVLGSKDGSTDFFIDEGTINGVTTPTNTVCRVYASGTQNLAGSATIIPLDTRVLDPGSCFNTSTHQYVCSVAGTYRVSGLILSYGPPGTIGAQLCKNGAQFAADNVYQGAVGTLTAVVTDIVECAVGDTIALYGLASAANSFSYAGESGASLAIELIAPLSSQAVAPNTGARAWLSGSAVVGNAAWGQIIFNTIDNDPGNHYSTTTGRYTATSSGMYEFEAYVDYQVTAGVAEVAALFKNGSAAAYVYQFNSEPSSSLALIGGSAKLFLEAGDYVDFRVFGNGETITGAEISNYFSGVKVDQGTNANNGMNGRLLADNNLSDVGSPQIALTNLLAAKPFGNIRYNSFVLSSPPGAWLGSYLSSSQAVGGVTIVNSGSPYGWEIEIPIAGIYKYTYSQRVDSADTSGNWDYAEAFLGYNHVASTASGYAITHVTENRGASYSTLVMTGYGNMNPGDLLNVYVDTGYGALEFQGQDDGINAQFCIEYVSSF